MTGGPFPHGGGTRIHIADPGFRACSGHHLSAALAVRAQLPAWKVVCHGYRHPDPDSLRKLEAAGVSYSGDFSSCLYEDFADDLTIADAQRRVTALVADYRNVVECVGQSGGESLMLHHTVDWPQILALALALDRRPSGAERCRHLVFLMFDPGVSQTGDVVSARRYLNYRVALALLSRCKDVRLFTSCIDYAAIYRSAFELPVEIGIHPCFHIEGVGQREHRVPVESTLGGPAAVLLYAGDAKAEKGFLALPDLARAMLEVAPDGTPIHVQFNLDRHLASPALEAAAVELEALAKRDGRLRLERRYLSEAELSARIRACAFMVFNYDPRIYANKTSGLLWQAAHHDAPVVVIGDSWLAREAGRTSRAFRVFRDVPEWVSAWGNGSGRLQFESGKVNDAYCRRLFRPLGEFVAEVFGGAGPDTGLPLLSESIAVPPRRVLFIDNDLPDEASSGGGYAAWREIELFQHAGWAVSFALVDAAMIDPVRVRLFSQRGVTLWHYPEHPDAYSILSDRGREFDVVYVTRFGVAERVTDVVRRFAPGAHLVLNLADLHFLRERRRARVGGDTALEAEADRIRDRELGAMRAADLVLSYSDDEIALIRAEGGDAIAVARCPWVDHVVDTLPVPYDDRRDIAFLGSFGHAPNVDAVLWFASAVLPSLRQQLPGIRLHVYGAGDASAVRACAGPAVEVHGFVEHVSEVYDRCRVFVAPLRFGAGLKGKLAGAMCRGAPSVVSPIAAEGFEARSDAGMAVAETVDDWVREIKRVYCDRAAWSAASTGALDYARRHFSFDVALRDFRAVLDLLNEGPKSGTRAGGQDGREAG